MVKNALTIIRLCIALWIASPAMLAAEWIIHESNRFPAVVGWTVGVQGGIPERNNLIDITTHGGDKTGVTNVLSAFNAAVTAASSGDVIYFPDPDGVYNGSNVILNATKDNITIRGQGGRLVGGIKIGPGGSAGNGGVFTITNGATKGSTNLVLDTPGMTNVSGGAIQPGDMFNITADFSMTNEVFQAFAIHGRQSIFQTVIIAPNGVNGQTVSITAPLHFTFSPTPRLTALHFIGNNASLKPRVGVGIENLTITHAWTNPITGTYIKANPNAGGGIGYGVYSDLARNWWVKDCVIEYATSYGIQASDGAYFTHHGNTIRKGGSGASHAGIVVNGGSGALIENNIITDQQPGVEFNGGIGYAIVGNFFTNNITGLDIQVHGTHPMMGIIEQNVGSVYIDDGYFGTSSHGLLFRNYLDSGVRFKRFTTFKGVVGNVLGNPASQFVWSDEANDSALGMIFQLGYPRVGNQSHNSKTNPPVGWNFPGSSYVEHDDGGVSGSGVWRTNGATILTNTVLNTNVITGDFTYVRSQHSGTYSIKFQDAANTNRYWPEDGISVYPLTAGTSSNLTLTFSGSRFVSEGSPAEAVTSMTFSNGWRVFVSYQNDTYVHLHQTNKATHTIDWNVVCTNASSYTLVKSGAMSTQTLSNSMVYPSRPDWWVDEFGNPLPWPGIGPDLTPYVGDIPPKRRFYGEIGVTAKNKTKVSGKAGGLLPLVRSRGKVITR